MTKTAIRVRNKEQANEVIDYFDNIGRFNPISDRELDDCDFDDLVISGEEIILKCNWAYGDVELYERLGYTIITFVEFRVDIKKMYKILTVEERLDRLEKAVNIASDAFRSVGDEFNKISDIINANSKILEIRLRKVEDYIKYNRRPDANTKRL
jgi:hypothetical protein